MHLSGDIAFIDYLLLLLDLCSHVNALCLEVLHLDCELIGALVQLKQALLVLITELGGGCFLGVLQHVLSRLELLLQAGLLLLKMENVLLTLAKVVFLADDLCLKFKLT